MVVIGGKNSAAIAALELWRHGARVTLIHRGAEMHRHVKYWIKPDIENRIKNGEIKAYFNSRVVEITPDTVTLRDAGRREDAEQRFCFCDDRLPSGFRVSGTAWACASRARTGGRCAIRRRWRAMCRAFTWPGVIVAGSRTNEIFIENGRFHGAQIARALGTVRSKSTQDSQ